MILTYCSLYLFQIDIMVEAFVGLPFTFCYETYDVCVFSIYALHIFLRRLHILKECIWLDFQYKDFSFILRLVF